MKLIKKLTLGAFLFAFAGNVSAQDFGIKGGLNYSTVSKGKFEEGPDPRTSFHIGFLGEIPIVPKVFAIQPEIVYSRQGFETLVKPIVGSNYKVTYQIDYVNVPVMAKLYLGRFISIEAGPQFGLKVSEKTESDNNSSDENNVNNFDTAIAAGLSFNFPGGVFLTGRFTQSLNEVVKDSDSKNMVFQAGIGFKM
ncbi:porin family protein [Flavobacterium humi]|uniref:PorT family protein n=1 Tax=Flavobacterium humi TaxID=2562683 RepID=A0A4Z0L374_9FLAO|nr:porin family protein [Flavobacterium humi]TGD56784.1 PorT family protein [Flavobacterium humi]